MSGRVRIPVNRFSDANLRDALLKLETGVNDAASRLDGILVQSARQASPPTIPADVVSGALYTLTPANVSTVAAAVGAATTASPGDHVHLLDVTAAPFVNYLLQNGTRPLTSAWDAGNFAVTLGSIVGKSGNLAITAASGGNIALTSSIASGSTAFTLTDSAVRTSGSYLALVDSFGLTRFSLGAPGSSATVLAVFVNSTDNYAGFFRFNGSVTSTGTFTAIQCVASQLGVGPATKSTGLLLQMTQHASSSFKTLLMGIDAGFVGSLSTGLSNWADKANSKIIGMFLGINLTSANTGAVPATVRAAGLLIGTAGAPSGGNLLPSYVGLGIQATAAATIAVSIAAEQDIQLTTGAKLVFDGAISITGTGLTPQAGTVASITTGDTYLAYNSGATQLDLFVDNAQAFHFDAGGAAGTSKCYGNMQIDGTTTSTGTLAATNAATVGTTLNVTGIATFATHVRLGDNDQIQLGDAQDSLIYYDGTNTIFNANAVGTGGVLFGDSASGPNFHIGRNGAGAFALCSGSARATTGTHFSFRDVGGISATLLTVATSGVSGVSTDIDHGQASGTLHIGPTLATTISLGRSGQQVTCVSNLFHTGATLGFYSIGPVAQSTGWSTSNVTSDKVLNANSTSIDQLADVVGSLIDRLLLLGVISA